MFLLEGEVQKLINTDIKKVQIKNAFLFACFTGLRYSDVKALTFDEVEEGYDGKQVYYRLIRQTVDKTVDNKTDIWAMERVCRPSP